MTADDLEQRIGDLVEANEKRTPPQLVIRAFAAEMRRQIATRREAALRANNNAPVLIPMTPRAYIRLIAEAALIANVDTRERKDLEAITVVNPVARTIWGENFASALKITDHEWRTGHLTRARCVLWIAHKEACGIDAEHVAGYLWSRLDKDHPARLYAENMTAVNTAVAAACKARAADLSDPRMIDKN